jgi:hypothetical protein
MLFQRDPTPLIHVIKISACSLSLLAFSNLSFNLPLLGLYRNLVPQQGQNTDIFQVI